jgi:hypothetical protein
VVAFSKLRGPSVLLGILVVASLLAGCDTGASSTSKTISVDGGALVIQPVKTQPVIYGKQAAIFNLEHSEPLGSGWSIKEVDFGYVTVKRTVAGGAVATPQPRLAWVIFYTPGAFTIAGGAMTGPVTCPGGQTPRAAAAGRSAMIVDATNEASFFYTGTGTTNCGVATRPVARYATQRVSVPWVDLGNGWVRATYPGCVSGGAGTPGMGSSAAPLKLEVMGNGVIGPCSSPPRTLTIQLGFPASMLNSPRPWVHGPLGPTYLGAFSSL